MDHARQGALARLGFLLAIDGARSSILITSPYFLPDDQMMEALERAAARGVRVSVLTTGETTEVQALIQHPMETGFRPGENGRMLERDIIRRFTCLYNNRPVFEAELHPAIAANPYLTLTIRVEESGILAFTWEGDNGFSQTETRALTVA